jgi:hypothetical protein
VEGIVLCTQGPTAVSYTGPGKQAVSRPHSTAAARIQSEIRSYGIYGGQSGTGENFLRVLHFLMSSRPALGSTQPPIQGVPGALFPGVKRPWRETHHSPPASTEVKKIWIYTSTPQYVFRGIFTLLYLTSTSSESSHSTNFSTVINRPIIDAIHIIVVK